MTEDRPIGVIPFLARINVISVVVIHDNIVDKNILIVTDAQGVITSGTHKAINGVALAEKLFTDECEKLTPGFSNDLELVQACLDNGYYEVPAQNKAVSINHPEIA